MVSNQSIMDDFNAEIFASRGKTIWVENGRVVKGFTLTPQQRKALDKACSVADCEQRWRGIPVDVFVVKEGDTIQFEMKERVKG